MLMTCVPLRSARRISTSSGVNLPEGEQRVQASRCMACGVAFCQFGASFGKARPSGCPLHNLIPEWNDLAWRGQWDEAAARLSLTSPMPEFTSRVCPALCEAACNLRSQRRARDDSRQRARHLRLAMGARRAAQLRSR